MYLAVLVTALVCPGPSWWAPCVAASAAVRSVRCAFVGHDAGHRQITRSTAVGRAVGRTHLTPAVGVARNGWNDRRHAHPDDSRRDPDVTDGPLAWTPARAAARNRAGRRAAHHQGLPFLPAVALDAALIRAAGIARLGLLP